MNGWFARGIATLALGLAIVCGQMSAPALAQKTETKTLTVFAAASLKNALEDANAAYTQSTGNKVVASYAASSALAKQIEQGAPADIFISADNDWMDDLAGKNLVKTETRKTLLGNLLVLVAPASSTVNLELKPGVDLAAALGGGRLAVGDVKAVPAGKYAKAALTSLGAWAGVEPHLAQSENVRAALALVAQGEAPLGIVYQTDAHAEPKVKIVATFPADAHPPIVYPVAITASTTVGDEANALIEFLASPAGAEIFAKHGFIIPKMTQ